MFIFNAYRLPVKTEAAFALSAFSFSSVLLLKAVSFFHPFIKARLMPKKQNFFIYLYFIPSLLVKTAFFLNKMPLFVFLFSFVMAVCKGFLPF